MAEYKTEQRRILIDFMTKYPELSLSADQWLEKMALVFKTDEMPSRSTVYRTMLKLEREGKVLRCVEGNSHTCKYQIASCHGHTHLHLKCIGCGTLIHMSKENSQLLSETVLKDNGFNVDEKQTVIYGRCTKCAEA